MSTRIPSSDPRQKLLRNSALAGTVLLALIAASCSSNSSGTEAATESPAGAESSESTDCAPSNGAEFICGVDNVEDFVRLPDGQLIGSDLAATGTQGHLFLFQTDRSVRTIEPQEIAVEPDPAYGACEVPDWNIFNPHGMGSVDIEGGRATKLYVVNHGGRDAVEIFDIDRSAEVPTVTWTGCLVPPAGAWPDDVAALPDGGMLVTSLWNPDDPDNLQKAVDGTPQGQLLKWTTTGQWSVLPGLDDISGPNGVITSPDGKMAYMAAWSGKQLVTIDLVSGAVDTENLDYTPDNLTWSADGSAFYIGGTTANVEGALQCFTSTRTNCPETGIRIDKYDPTSKSVQTLVQGSDFGQFGMATGAIDVGEELWVNSYRSDRVAIFDEN
ncbi:hypothetical protein [Rhodococcoides fascians]|uniref:hypothetical protein n=1 Tax=Rhodococcoides fascians TaxID=1828 RepID=UPI001D374F75|nr:hypothetical protein [Rhodococcus fascians]CAH0310089.1 hypothetical protein SRABI91_04895 [Rhodococcus fascians]